jgi:hypothetical protein
MQFGFKIVVGPADGHLHVVMPYRQHFSRFYGRPGRAEYVLDRRSGRMLWGA